MRFEAELCAQALAELQRSPEEVDRDGEWPTVRAHEARAKEGAALERARHLQPNVLPMPLEADRRSRRVRPSAADFSDVRRTGSRERALLDQGVRRRAFDAVEQASLELAPARFQPTERPRAGEQTELHGLSTAGRPKSGGSARSARSRANEARPSAPSGSAISPRSIWRFMYEKLCAVCASRCSPARTFG